MSARKNRFRQIEHFSICFLWNSVVQMVGNMRILKQHISIKISHGEKYEIENS